MITAGLDIGTRYTKALVLDNGKISGWALNFSGVDLKDTADDVLNNALSYAKISRDKLDNVFVSGNLHDSLRWSYNPVNPINSTIKGINYLNPRVHTVIDIGAEESRVARCENGRLMDFSINDVCSAGAGSFLEVMSKILDIPLNKLGVMSDKSSNSVKITTQCTVFAESEVISLIHNNVPIPNIVHGIFESLARKIKILATKVGLKQDVALVGGLGVNKGFSNVLQTILKTPIIIPRLPQYTTALGAALSFQDEG